MNKVIEFFKNKGVIATWIGMILSIPVNARAVYQYFNNIEMSEASLTALVVVNIIAMVWFILPSRIVIMAGKFEIRIED